MTMEAFRGQGFLRDARVRHASGAEIPMQDLPPFLRALLVTDGTVTKILEAYFWEPVEVMTLSQEFTYAESSIARLGLDSGDRVLIRRARLGGMDSGRAYATATSVIRTQLIPEAFRQRLIDRQVGIGVLIRDSGMESYREVLEIGVEPAGKDEGNGPAVPGKADLVFRTYRVIVDGEPVILIRERFPLNLYTPPHIG